MKSTTDAVLDCTWSVNDVLKRYPMTMEVFNRHGIDLCCGGVLSVDEAATQEGVDKEVLCAELRAVAAE